MKIHLIKFSTAALVLGIVSLVLAWFYMINIVALACAIVGLVLATKGRKAAAAAGDPSGLGTAGLVLSIIGLIFAAIGFLTCTVCVICTVACAQAGLNDLNNALNGLV